MDIPSIHVFLSPWSPCYDPYPTEKSHTVLSHSSKTQKHRKVENLEIWSNYHRAKIRLKQIFIREKKTHVFNPFGPMILPALNLQRAWVFFTSQKKDVTRSVLSHSCIVSTVIPLMVLSLFLESLTKQTSSPMFLNHEIQAHWLPSDGWESLSSSLALHLIGNTQRIWIPLAP